jgi:hypothetical protein
LAVRPRDGDGQHVRGQPSIPNQDEQGADPFGHGPIDPVASYAGRSMHVSSMHVRMIFRQEIAVKWLCSPVKYLLKMDLLCFDGQPGVQAV